MAEQNFMIHVEVPQERLNEISNRYINGVLVRKEPVNREELEKLSCSELMLLRHNTKWFAENLLTNPDQEQVDALLEEFLECVELKITGEDIYVIFTSLTHLPYLLQHQYMMIYTNQDKAKEVAEYFQSNCKREGVTFEVKTMTPGNCDFWALASASGMDEFILDGAKEPLKVSDFYTLPEKYGKTNPEFSKAATVIAQISGFNGEKKVFDANIAVIESLLPVMKPLIPAMFDKDTSGQNKVKGFRIPILKREDGSMWQPVFTDQFAVNEYFKNDSQSTIASETIQSIYENFLKGKEAIKGIIINPGTNQLAFETKMIEQLIAKKKQ